MIGRCLIGLLAALLLVSVPGEAQKVLRNKIQNPSFEFSGRDTVRERPDESWTFKTDNDNVIGRVTSSRAIDGFRSYLIRAEESRGFLESDPFDVDRYERYIFSFGVCGDGIVVPEIRWWREENDSLSLVESQYLSTVLTTEDWSVPQYEVTAPRRATSASVRFAVSKGYVWIDDVRFR